MFKSSPYPELSYAIAQIARAKCHAHAEPVPDSVQRDATILQPVIKS